MCQLLAGTVCQLLRQFCLINLDFLVSVMSYHVYIFTLRKHCSSDECFIRIHSGIFLFSLEISSPGNLQRECCLSCRRARRRRSRRFYAATCRGHGREWVHTGKCLARSRSFLYCCLVLLKKLATPPTQCNIQVNCAELGLGCYQ